jgi:hypothetical protein
MILRFRTPCVLEDALNANLNAIVTRLRLQILMHHFVRHPYQALLRTEPSASASLGIFLIFMLAQTTLDIINALTQY